MLQLPNMETLISGRAKNINKRETRAVLEWIARELRVDRYKTELLLDVKFVKNLLPNTGGIGWCIWEDDNYRPRAFSIEIDADLGPQKVIKTLFHEMVHVQQYASGRMVDLLRGFSTRKWCGKVIDVDGVAYRKQPWEIEAWAFEKMYWDIWKVYKRKKHENVTFV